MASRAGVVAVAGLLVLAGCTGIVPELDGSEECVGYPPGTNGNGIENATVLLANHRRALVSESYVGRIELRVVQHDTATDERMELTYDSFTVYAEPSTPRYLSVGVEGVGFWNDSEQYVMFADRDRGRTAFLRSRRPPVGPARRTGVFYLSQYAFLRGGNYHPVGVVPVENGSGSLVKFRASRIVDRDALPGNGYFYRNATSLNGTLLVDRRGRIRFAHVVVRARRSDTTVVRAKLTLRYWRLGETRVPVPTWVGKARSMLRSTSERSVTVDRLFDPGDPTTSQPRPNASATTTGTVEPC